MRSGENLAERVIGISSMAARRCLRSLSNGLCQGTRSFGAVPEAAASASGSQKLINLEYECSAHK